MEAIKNRLQVAMMLAVFMPAVLQAISTDGNGETIVKWTITISLLTFSYLMIEFGPKEIISGADKAINFLLAITITSFAVMFTAMAWGELSDPVGYIKGLSLIGSIYVLVFGPAILFLLLVKNGISHYFL